VVRAAAASPGAGLVDRMARTWVAPRAAAAAEIAAASEPRLLFYAFAASLFAVLGAIGAQALNPDPAIAPAFEQWAATTFVVGLFMRPLGLYGAAALIGLVCRRFGGTGGWRDTRAAFFWTALTAAPAAAALEVLGAAATGLAGAGPAAAALGHAAGGVLWAALLAPALAQAHGFASAWRVLACLAAVGAVLGALAAATPG
jgi:hypothetical protein